MNQYKRNKILNTFNQLMPYPVTELNYSSAFELLIAVILSAQSTDINVNRVTKKLYRIANTPSKILNLGVDKLKFYIKSIGLFNKKANSIIQLCSIIISAYSSKVPGTRKDLESLPGVGRKTANVILNTIFHYPVIAVDTHVFRVCRRTNFVSGHTLKNIENNLNKYVDPIFKLYVHNWFVLHGRYVCTARKPKCNICCIRVWCEYND
ncbi:MAG: endonuclease III [Buchnera aphidicola (Eriosoma harunire)]